MKQKISHRKCSVRKGVPRNFAKFTGKHLRQSLFFNKVGGLSPEACKFIKKRLWHRCFPVNFAKFLRAPFLTEHVLWLLLIKTLHTYDVNESTKFMNKYIPIDMVNILLSSIATWGNRAKNHKINNPDFLN